MISTAGTNTGNDAAAKEENPNARYSVNPDDILVSLYEAENALRDYNTEAEETGKYSPIFFRDDTLVTISPDDEGVLTVKPVNEDQFSLILTTCGSWKGAGVKRGMPPKELRKIFYNAGYERLNSSEDLPPAVPILKGIHTGVLLNDEWELVHTKGYDRKTKLYLTEGYEVQPLPETITEEDVKAARELLRDIFKEFLFEDAEKGEESVHYQNTLTALFTAIIRPIWKGALPIFQLEKSNYGTGGTLLQEILVILAYGEKPKQIRRIGYPKEGEASYAEYDKTIRGAILQRWRYGLIDNIPRGKEWVTEQLLTQSSGSGNVDIRNMRTLELTHRSPDTFFMVNGINLQSSNGDISRRIIPARLISKKSLQELKDNFNRTKEQLWELAYKKHPEVIRAYALLHRYWVQKGRPEPKPCGGNISEYTEWYREIVGTMHAAGYTHILDNLEDLQTDENEEEVRTAGFINGLQRTISGKKNPDGTPLTHFTPANLRDWIMYEVANIKDISAGEISDKQDLIPYLSDEVVQLALKNVLTPEKARYVLKPLIDSKVNGCNYILRKSKRQKKGIPYFLEDVVKQVTLDE